MNINMKLLDLIFLFESLSFQCTNQQFHKNSSHI